MQLKTLAACLCLSFCAMAAAPSHAQDFPSRPIRLVIGFSAGGSTDAIARLYAQKLAEVLKVAVVVENKAGAGQVLAIKTVTTSPADGHTLYLGSGSAFSQGPGVRKDLSYDPLKDLTLIGLVATAPGVVVVTPNLPVRNVAELIKYSNDNPNKLNYGSSGVGSASHLQGEYMLNLARIKMTHIPYKADADIFREMAAGNLHMGIAPAQGAMSAIGSGRVRPLAVTGSRRLKALPDVPSLSEVGVKGLEGIDPYTYYGVAGPAGLPPAVVNRLNGALNAVSKMPDVAAQVRERQFAEPATSTPDSFRQYIEADIRKWKAFAPFVNLTE